MADRSQLLRGTLEGCILQVIARRETYGYEIAARLAHYGFEEVKEGTLYPLLVRLERKALVQAVFRPSPLGPSRKYYTLTPAGQQALETFQRDWHAVAATVRAVLAGDDPPD